MVEIIPYQPSWPAEFLAVANVLRQALGRLALRIDHIGSTAVPGLPAKDVIDIQVSVAALDGTVESAMRSAGFVQRQGRTDHRPPGAPEPGSAWAKWLFLSPPDRRRANVHVRLAGSPNERYAVLFRDFLRARPASAEAYANLKRKLAQSLSDPEMYPEVKEPAVDLIYLAAEDWAAKTNWHPGHPDA